VSGAQKQIVGGAITRLDASTPIARLHRSVPHFAANQHQPRSNDDEPRQRTHLALACLVCLSLRFGDLGDISAVIGDIPQDHPDRMRIVIALNAGRCPECNACGFDLKPRVGISRNIFCRACDQGFNISPDAPKVYFVQRIGRRRPA